MANRRRAKGQTIQWPTEKEQKDNDLQNITQKTNDGATRTPLKTGGEIKCTTYNVKPVMSVFMKIKICKCKTMIMVVQ